MSSTAPAQGRGRLRISQVVYHCDLTDSQGPVIPLGVIIDIRVDRVYGLGLKARKALSDQEISMIGELARPLLRHPFDALMPEFEAIWDAEDPAISFCELAQRHPGSLQTSPSIDKTFHIPDLLLVRALKKPEILSQWTEDKLSGECDVAFWNLLMEHLPEDATSANEEHREREVA